MDLAALLPAEVYRPAIDMLVSFAMAQDFTPEQLFEPFNREGATIDLLHNEEGEPWGVALQFRILKTGPGEKEFWVVWWGTGQGQQNTHVIHVVGWQIVGDSLSLTAADGRRWWIQYILGEDGQKAWEVAMATRRADPARTEERDAALVRAASDLI